MLHFDCRDIVRRFQENIYKYKKGSRMKITKSKKIIFAAIVLPIIALAAVCIYFRYPQYELIELGTLNGEYTTAIAINNIGQIVGCSKVDNNDHAFIWDEKTGIKDLGTLGGAESFAWDINDKGQVVGQSDTAEGFKHAFLWDPDKGMIDLGTLGGLMSMAFALNNQGQIVGNTRTTDGQTHAFLWHASTGMTDLGTLYGKSTTARDINERGQIVGSVIMENSSLNNHAFYWDKTSGMIDIVGSKGQSSYANSINNSGMVAGNIFDPNKNNYDAFIWQKEKGLTRFNIPAIESYADEINNKGQIVGHIRKEKFLFIPAKKYYFLRTKRGRIINLNRFTGSEGYSIEAKDINDNGWIAGEHTRGSSTTRAILLKPR